MDGFVLIGGAEFTFVIGVMAIIRRIPLIACSRYGGRASIVWHALKSGRGLLTEDEADVMDREASLEMALKCVELIENQEKRRDQESHPVRKVAALVALGLLVAVVGMIVLWFYPFDQKHNLIKISLLFLGPLVGALGGAAVGSLFRHANFSWETCATGAAAGLMSAYFYIVGQGFLGGKDLPLDDFKFYLFVVIFGIAGGFTADKVLAQFETIEALKTKRSFEEGRGESKSGSGE